MKNFLAKPHSLFLLATMSLSLATFFSSKSITEKLNVNFESQNKTRYLLKVKSALSRSNSLIAFSLILEDKKIFGIGEDIFKKLQVNVLRNKNKMIELSTIIPLLDKYDALLNKLKKSMNKKVPINQAMAIVQSMEYIEKKLSALEDENFGKLVANNQKLIQSQREVQNLFKYFHWTLTIILYVLAYISSKKEKLMEQIKQSEELHRLLISSLAEGVLFCDERGTIVTCNQSAESILGITRDKLLGRKIFSIFSNASNEQGEVFENHNSPFVNAIGKGTVSSNIIVRYARGRFFQMWLSLSSQPLYMKKGDKSFSTIFSFADLTEKVEQQRTIEKQQANLIYSSKMTALGQMAGGIAHEINNPLAVIKAEAEDIIDIVEEEGNIDKQTAMGAAETISKTTGRIARIIRGLKIFSHSDTSQRTQKILVSEIFHDVMALCEDKAKRKNVDLRLRIMDKSLLIDCQSTQIYQVFVNLINNAFDAIENLNEKWIQIDIGKVKDEVVIKVIDSGPGIPEELRDKILQPFFTTKDVGKGTGLGLSISKGIIESHQGVFFIDSRNANTCFVIKLPFVEQNQSSVNFKKSA